MLRLNICCAILLLTLIDSVRAGTVIFQFSGEITQVPEGDIPGGNAFSGSFSFDPATPNLTPGDSGQSSYASALPFDVIVGSSDFATNSFSIGILNAAVDQYAVFASSPDSALTIELLLQDDTGTVLTGTALPSSPPSLDAFDVRTFAIFDNRGDSAFEAEGTVDSLTIEPSGAATPEPSEAPALVAALASLAIVLRRRLLHFR